MHQECLPSQVQNALVIVYVTKKQSVMAFTRYVIALHVARDLAEGLPNFKNTPCVRYELKCYVMSGTPAIDTRSQNSFIKQKQSKTKAKGKANKKAKQCSCAYLSLFFPLFFRFIFAFFSFFFSLFS